MFGLNHHKFLITTLMLAMISSGCVKRSVKNDDPAAAESSSAQSSTDSSLALESTSSDDDFDLALDESTPATTETTTPPAETAITSDDQFLSDLDSTATMSASEPLIEDHNMMPEIVDSNATSSSSQPITLESEYVVQSQDTLMLIAHKIYGDHTRWRELWQKNQETLKGSKQLRTGTVIKYNPPENLPILPAGEPYLIELRDTLGKISGKVYQTPRRWKDIWKNNPYIKDPNVIFAGFTLYYLKDEKVANRL